MKKAYKLQLNDDEVSEVKKYVQKKSNTIFLEYLANETETQQKLPSFIESIIDKIQNTQEIDMVELSHIFFPTDKKFKVFISHSHADKKLAKGLSQFLSERRISSFIDSEAWEHIDILKKLLSDKVEKSSDVEMLLTVSLLQMIDNCDYFIFLETDNSIRRDSKQDKLSTYSSWLFLELSATKFMRRKGGNVALEEHMSKLNKDIKMYYYTLENDFDNITFEELKDLFSKKVNLS